MLPKTATVERTRRPSIAKTNVSYTTPAILAQRAGLSTGVMTKVALLPTNYVALETNLCVMMGVT